MCGPHLAGAQSFVNPDTIQQRGDIILHRTDVYYCPVAPPSDSDTRGNLSAAVDLLNSPNGVDSLEYPQYNIITRDSLFRLTHPCTDSNNGNRWIMWERLFQAMRGSDGTPHDIIAGGDSGDYVIVKKNEDVDFRASGTIKLKNGFHAEPGCFFHAYQSPKWDTAVFSDEFNDTATFRNQWYVANGYGGQDYPTGPEVHSDTNVNLVRDDTGASPAHDGYALDLMMRMDTVDSFSSQRLIWNILGCSPVQNPLDSSLFKSIFSTVFLKSCPYPYKWNTDSALGPPAYAHAPYGKYEFRIKLPDILVHTNNWGSTWDMEYDLGETQNATMGALAPGFGKPFYHGPAHGVFVSRNLFVSQDAGWNAKEHNVPTGIAVNGFGYIVNGNYVNDTCTPMSETLLSGGFPASLVGDTVSFLYRLDPWHTADTVTWTITFDSVTHHWDIFHAPYHIDSLGDSSFFGKDYQPVQITLSSEYDSVFRKRSKETFNCRWEHTLNALLLDQWGDHTQDSLLDAGIHSYTEAYPYQMVDLYTPGYGLPGVSIYVNNDTITSTDPAYSADTAALDTVPYKYHTFTMEFLPHEIRYFYDSVEVRRVPDRLIPPSNKYADFISKEPRSPAIIFPAQLDVDNGDAFQLERSYFANHPYNPGCWDVTIGGKTYHAAHERLDYVKVLDVPKDVIIPGYPK